jgi:hypothetical protein
VISLLSPLVRDPGRPRQSFRTSDAAGIAAGIIGVGAASVRLTRAGADALIDRARAAGRGGQANGAAGPRATDATSLSAVSELVYELLDAHEDTAQMAAWFRCDPDWREHLQRLQTLQRQGRETLAHLCLDTAR